VDAQPVGPRTLAEAFRDLEVAVRAFCSAVLESSSASAGVLLATPASSEIQEEARLVTEMEPVPVKAGHTFIRLGHLFVIDQLRALARLPALEPPALFAPFVIARSVLDTAGAAYWLAEPGISTDQRVQRRLVTNVLQARVQQVPQREEFADKLAELKSVPEHVRQYCSTQGWTFDSKDPPRIEEQERPSQRVLLGEVVDPDRDNLRTGLGATLWWFLSGYTHGSFDALISVLEVNPDSDPATPNAMIMVDGARLVWLVFVAARAARRLTERRAALFGDMAPDVESTGHELEIQLLRYLEAAKEGRWP
jgi:hypothetical protein